MIHLARQLLGVALDVVLGPPCRVCGTRVRGEHLTTHTAIDHPGEVAGWTP